MRIWEQRNLIKRTKISEATLLRNKLKRIGFGYEEKRGRSFIIYESWCEDCLLMLKVRTYKEALAKRNAQLEKDFNIKLIDSHFKKLISVSRFKWN